MGAGPRLPAGTVGTKPHRPPGRARHSSPLGPARDQLLRGLKAKVVWTFNYPDKTENTLPRQHWVTIANSDFKSGHKTETLNMFFAFFPTLATHLILTLRFQFPES